MEEVLWLERKHLTDLQCFTNDVSLLERAVTTCKLLQYKKTQNQQTNKLNWKWAKTAAVITVFHFQEMLATSDAIHLMQSPDFFFFNRSTKIKKKSQILWQIIFTDVFDQWGKKWDNIIVYFFLHKYLNFSNEFRLQSVSMFVLLINIKQSSIKQS